MKLLDKRESSWIPLKDLPVGETFEFTCSTEEGEIYFKTDRKDNAGDIYCVNLNSGPVFSFSGLERVKPLNTQLIVLNKGE